MIVSIFTLGVIAVGSLVVEHVSSKPTRSHGCGKRPAPAVDASTNANNNNANNNNANSNNANDPTSCFPGIGFTMPTSTPNSLTGWWCSTAIEYAFVGFSYDVTSCQSLSTLKTDFLNIRQKFNGRYVRMYGACDDTGFYDNIVEAAWDAGIGVHALIWFGFNGGNQWQTRRNLLYGTLHSNPKAPFVTRVLQFGSEPLYDGVLSPSALLQEVKDAKQNLSSLGIPVTVSDMAYGWQMGEGEDSSSITDLMGEVDLFDAHMLPYFGSGATTGDQAWPAVTADLDWFVKNGQNKKIFLSENGWPSNTAGGTLNSNSHAAVASVQSEEGYFNLLDEQCSYLKTVAGGGVGWFAHVYSENQDEGYGIYGSDGNLKFNFAPKTSC